MAEQPVIAPGLCSGVGVLESGTTHRLFRDFPSDKYRAMPRPFQSNIHVLSYHSEMRSLANNNVKIGHNERKYSSRIRTKNFEFIILIEPIKSGEFI
jgi:hypothetical protein